MIITYRDDAPLTVEQAIDLYRRSTLAERRPVDRPDTFAGMLANADLTITAWDGDRLVGVARSLSDFTYVTYLSDLAVDQACQRQGVGARLIEETRRRVAPESMLVLLSAPAANAYYPKVGFEHHPRAWVIKNAGLPTPR